jgi:choline dehydrogenase-like flavoprotein
MSKRICVIGAGLAGGIISSQLAKLGHDVTLLEMGEAPLPIESAPETWEGSALGLPYTRGTGLGGTTNFWHGGLIAMDPYDVEGPSETGEPRYPISYAELARYYAPALDLLSGQKLSPPALEAIGTSSLRHTKGLGDKFRLKPLFYPPKPFSTQALILETAGLAILPHFEVKRLVFAGSKVVGAEGVHQRTKEAATISADLFVLCAGGIGSPKILLASQDAPAGVRALPVGTYLTDHPTGVVFKAKLKKYTNLRPLFGESLHGGIRRYGLALREEMLHEPSRRNHLLYLRPASSLNDPYSYQALKHRLITHRRRKFSLSDAFGVLKQPDLLFDSLNFRYRILNHVKYVSGLICLEQRPDAANHMLLHEGRFTVRWKISDAEIESMKSFLDTFFEEGKSIIENFTLFPDSQKRLTSGAHHSGGCRMAHTPAHGVVDKHAQVFGTDNLFITDGSILPYAGHANTGLSIAALAFRCADIIHKEFV